MTQNCCVQGCRHNKRTSACTFKKFPSDPQRSKVWETLVRRSVGSRPGAPEWKRSPCDRICECHFDSDQFETDRQDGFFKLRWDAVPRLFGSKAKTPSHRSLNVLQKTVVKKPEDSKVVENNPLKNPQHIPKMSSEESLQIDEDLGESNEHESLGIEEQEHEATNLTEENLITDGVSSIAVDAGTDFTCGSEVVAEAADPSEMAEAARAGISVIASTAEAEAYLYAEVEQATEGSEIEVNSEGAAGVQPHSGSSPTSVNASEAIQNEVIEEHEATAIVDTSSVVNEAVIEDEIIMEDEAGDEEDNLVIHETNEKTILIFKDETYDSQTDAQIDYVNEEGELYIENDESIDNGAVEVNEVTSEKADNVVSEEIDQEEVIAESEVIEQEDAIDGNDVLYQEESVDDNEALVQDDATADNEESAQDEAIAGNELSAQDEASAGNEDPAQDGVIAENEVLAQDEVSAENEVLAQDEACAEDEVLAQDEVSAENEVLAQDEACAEDEVPAQDEACAENEVPAQDEACAENEVPAQDEAVAENEVPAQDETEADAENEAFAQEEAIPENETSGEEVAEIEANTGGGVAEVESNTGGGVAEVEASAEETDESFIPNEADENFVPDKAEMSGLGEEEGTVATSEVVSEYDEQGTSEEFVAEDNADETNVDGAEEAATLDQGSSNDVDSSLVDINHVSESQEPHQDNVSSDQTLEAEGGEQSVDQDDADGEADAEEGNVAEECEEDGGEGFLEDEGDGEEFAGEEEEFEDGEEMGDEVEVEIEDCSDPEMEAEGGVTYIISEGMIVVEENESSEAFQSGDDSTAVEEEHIICDDQIGSGQKTTRIVIKMPSSKTSSETGNASAQEIVCTEVIKTSEEHTLPPGDVNVTQSVVSEQHSVDTQEDKAEMAQSTETVESRNVEDNRTTELTGEIDTVNLDVSERNTQHVENESRNVEDNRTTELTGEIDTVNLDVSERNTQHVENTVLNQGSSKDPAMVSKAECKDVTEKTNDSVAVIVNNVESVVVTAKTDVKDVKTKTTSKEAAVAQSANSIVAAKSHKTPKSKDVSKVSSQPPQPAGSSGNVKSTDKLLTKSSKTETKGSKVVHEKTRNESSKEKGSDVSKHSSKPTHSLSNKHKSQSSKTDDSEEKTSTKSSSKHETVAKEEQLSKSDSSKKQTEVKDVAAGESHPSGKSATPSKQNSSGHRTRSNSTSSRDSSQKDKRSSRKDEKPHSEGSTSSSATNADAKVALRSSRSRKSHSDAADTSVNSPETVQVKKDKSKTIVETPQRQRQSERVCKATEKAIASGLVSRRSKIPNADSDSPNSPEKQASEKAQDSGSDDTAASQRRSKRKADSQPASKEEAPVSKRRTTRSGDAQSSNETSETATTVQLLRSARKNKSLKRKGSSSDLPPAKQAHTDESSSKDKVPKEFIADIPKMCRICGSKNENLLNVFGPEGRTMQLPEKVHSILPIKIREEEPLPTGVCHSCVVTLMACEKLVEKCLNIDSLLRVHFKCPLEKPSEEKKEDLPQEPPTEQIQIPEKTPEKPVKTSTPVPPQPSAKASDVSISAPEEKSALKAGHVTRSSSRVSAKNKQVESSKPAEVPAKLTNKVTSQESPKTGKANVVDAEDSPPVLEAEPPQSHLPASNQEPSAQPPVLVPQPGKSGPEEASTPGEDPSAKRFGNTYHVRMKPTQWEKIERGLEAIHGESQEVTPEAAPSEPKRYGTITTEEFHIVDLDMNVEEVPPEEPVMAEKGQPVSAMQEFHIEIPADTPEEETAVQQSSPKSVIDSILVDWSGDEDEVTPVQKVGAGGSERKGVAGGKDGVNGSSQRNQTQSKTPCLFGEDEEGDAAPQGKSKSTPVVIKQESFWPEPSDECPSDANSAKPQGEVPWKCFVCGKRGKSLSKFLEHKKLHLNDRKLVSCPKCSESFSNMSLLKAHQKAHHGDDDEDEVVVQETKQIQVRPKSARLNRSVVDVDLAPATDGLYHCSSCQSAFASIESLCQHKLIHQKNDDADMFKCTTCKKTFYHYREFQQHIATHQPSAPSVSMFQCAKCNMKMTNQKEFIEHIESHNADNQNYTCDLCNKIFDTKHKLRSHRSTVHKSTAYACHLCDKVCQKRIALIEHLRKHTGDNPFACPVCNKRFNRLANYKAHMVIHENARRYECPYCGKRFNRQSIQQRHIKTHTSEQSRKHRCRVCNLTFGLATEMFTHRRLHTREEVERATWEDEKLRLALTSFPCKICQAPFNTVEDVLLHMPQHGDEERDIAAKLKNPKLECDICGKVLNSKRTFNSHRSSHIDGKPFVCKICSKGYSTSTGLNYHMLSHTGERPFPCTFCHKGYKNSTDLKVHMRQHTGEFPYKCNKCNKAFRSASSLQKHGFVHSEVRPFKCQYCHMSFKRESTKHNHERIHTNDRRYKCKVCARTFIQKGACDAHEKLHYRGGTQLFMGTTRQVIEDTSASSSKSEKHDLYEEFEEEEDFDDDDDDEDEYIIYEDEDGVDDDDDDGDIDEGDEREMDVDTESSQKEVSMGNLTKIAFVDTSKSSNGVDLPVTNITAIPVTMSSDAVPSVGDSSVHITIL